MRKWLWLSAAVVVLDQISKWIASHQLSLHEPVEILPHLNLTLVHNRGASFGLLGEADGWQRWFFIVLAIAVSIYLYRWLVSLTPEARWTGTGLVLIIGGAIGNMLDRLILGYVVDFVDVYYGAYHWPVFNLADGSIVLGAMIVIMGALLIPQEEK